MSEPLYLTLDVSMTPASFAAIASIIDQHKGDLGLLPAEQAAEILNLGCTIEAMLQKVRRPAAVKSEWSED